MRIFPAIRAFNAGMRMARIYGWLFVVLWCCQMEKTDTPAPRPAVRDAAPVAAVDCMSDERQWGTTCCRSQGVGRRRWMSCRGPQLGKTCHKKSDCDITCGCDPSLIHHDGETGATGHCTGTMPSGEWLCTLDEAGRVSSLIID